jgi:hypothetical protein
MFDKPYQFIYCNYKIVKTDQVVYKEHKLLFKCRFNNRYIVNVEEYENFVYVIKFHLKSHSLSKNKYKLRTNLKDANRVIMTCINIMLFFYEKNPYSSFGFIGSNDLGESENATKRFNFYKRLMETFFSPIKFVHLEYPKRSAYLLLNRDNLKPSLKKEIESLFLRIYPNTFSL